MDYYHGKLALITGAGSGIGKSIAGRLASFGATVIVTDIDSDGVFKTMKDIRDKGGSVCGYPLDVTDPDAICNLSEDIHHKHGTLDFLFNNAGIGIGGDFLSVPGSAWRKVLDINVMGIVNCSSAFVPAMIAGGKGGHVINTASVSSFFPMYNMATYAASKYAALGISGCQRLEWERHGIRVTAVCPGIINTNVVKNMLTFGVVAKEGVREMAVKMYAKRGYSPDKVAAAVLKKIPKAPYILPVSPEAWFTYFLMRLNPSSMFLQKKAKQKRRKP